ncbi:MAG: hypothetical protein WD757_04310 [Actinomycetota bacterium]
MGFHPGLQSAERKIGRAREHIIALEAEQDKFGDKHPYPLTTRFKDHDQPNISAIVVESMEQPPEVMGLILGDALGNLRGALDHVAWQLAKRGTKLNLTPEQESKVGFPIYDSESKFSSALDTYIPGIRPEHEAVVRHAQPYQRGELAVDHPLAVLQRLSNDDKHRLTHTVLWTPMNLDFGVDICPDGCVVNGFTDGPDLGKELKVDAVLKYLHMVDKRACDGMEVKAKGTLSISLGDGSWVHEVVRQIERMVSDVLAETSRVL